MALSRRKLLQGSAATTTALALSSTIDSASATSVQSGSSSAPAQQISPAAAPDTATIAMHRMAYGPRPGDIERVRSIGFERYVEEQLTPSSIDDSACDALIAQARLKIKYDAVHEVRPLSNLNKSLGELWEQHKTNTNYSERIRPFEEVRVATWIRAVHSKRQLFEMMVEFWHNHFNVNATSDTNIATTFPVYDQIMRKNCFGNFRTFVEEVGRSVAMMYSLDNVSNRVAGGEGGNENYARELIELHTLGSDNYLKFYDKRGSIATITYGEEVFPIGYIDDDVYEASRCFTGWTIANGHWERPSQHNGSFLYDPKWHDTYPKTVLAPRPAPGIGPEPNIPRNQPDLADGRKVFDLLARHPGTARHICTKLCRRFVADTPPQDLIDAAVNTWMKHRSSPDQITRVMRTILGSQAFRISWALKVKRPFESTAAFLRATKATLPQDYVDPANADNGALWNSFNWQFSSAGHSIFQWPTPTGHPDIASYWASTNGMLRRWNMPHLLTQSWGGGVKIDIVGQTNLSSSCTQIIDFWIARLCGFSINPQVRQVLIDFLAQGGSANEPPKPLKGAPDWNSQDAVKERLVSAVQLIAAAPDFHTR